MVCNRRLRLKHHVGKLCRHTLLGMHGFTPSHRWNVPAYGQCNLPHWLDAKQVRW